MTLRQFVQRSTVAPRTELERWETGLLEAWSRAEEEARISPPLNAELPELFWREIFLTSRDFLKSMGAWQ